MVRVIDYTALDQPYDANLMRGAVSSVPNGQFANDKGNGNVEIQPVKSDGGMGDVWIKNFIRSDNWSPKKRGFYINGRTGYAEFTNVYVSGNIEALSGTIGGFTITEDYLTYSEGGRTTRLGGGVGGTDVLISGTTGSPNFILSASGSLTAANASISGSIYSSYISGTTISGGNINGTTITGALIRTASSGERIEIASNVTNKISFYDSTDLIGIIEVDRTGDYGYLKFLSPDGYGLSIEYNVAASTFSEINLGGFSQGGTSSNGGLSMTDSSGTATRYFKLIHTGNGTPYIETDALPTSNPGGSGILWNDSGVVKIT